MKRKCLAVGIILLFIGTAIIPSSGQKIEKLSLPMSRGNTLYVGGSGPGNYTRIQDAINNAFENDTVYVYNGTYFETIQINKPLRLIGENKTTTVIDGSSLANVVNVSADLVTISEFTIQHAGGPDYAVGISVYGDNCTIMDSHLAENDFGIWLFESNNSIISNVTLQNHDYNIFLGDWDEKTSANYPRIHNNIISDSHIGIEVTDFCLEPSIFDNYFANCYTGVDIYCDNATITNNVFQNISLPIYMSTSLGTTILDNKINSTSRRGIEMDYCRNSNISENEFSECGIMIFATGIQYFNHRISTDNTVNGKPLYYFFNQNVDIEGWDIGELILVKCSGVVANVSIIHTSYAIQLAYCSNVTICDSSLQNNGNGISLIYSDHNTIKNNLVSNNTVNGCHVDIGSTYNQLVHNSFSMNEMGVFVEDNNNVIVGNVVDNNGEHGIYLNGASHNTISDNIITKSEYGLDIGYSANNTITRNRIASNSMDGIRINPWSSNNNTIYHNNFENNTNQTFVRGNNTWDNGYPSGGNYWDDYHGADANADGIGDTPYNISGYGENQDHYPLILPYGITKLSITIQPKHFRLLLFIKNVGNTTAFNVKWNITINGFVLFGKKASGFASRPLLPEQEILFTSNKLFIGLGRIEITVTAGADNVPVVTTKIHGILILWFFRIIGK